MIGDVYQSNCDGPVEIIEQDGGKVTVKFLNTGFEREALLHNVQYGKVRDNSITDRGVTPEKVYTDEIVSSNTTGDFKILWIQGVDCLVQFIETGFTKQCNIHNARKGKVRDPYYPSVYGLGYEGEFDKKQNPHWKQANQLWRNMMKRCYSTKDPRGYYGTGVSVDSRWLCFANFLEDLKCLENFDKWLDGYKPNNPKYNLDKDLKVKGNKVYSRNTCMFVTEFENKSEGSKNSLEIHGLIHLRKRSS